MGIIELENLTKDYGDTKGIENLNFEVKTGKYSVFLVQMERVKQQRLGF